MIKATMQMSGWYVNHRGVCVGRGSGKGRGRGIYNPKTGHINNTLEDYLFYAGSIKQASYYEITAEFIVNHIKNTFDRVNDVSEAFLNMVK